MIPRLLRRLGWSFLVVWATVTLAFLVNNGLPSDPARMVAGPQARPQDVERIRKDLGLDRPLHVQYARFMGRLVHVGPREVDGDAKRVPKDKDHATCALVGPVHFDLGKSFQQRRPVITVIAERLPRTVMLAVAAAFVQALLGMLFGTIAAARKRTIVDQLAVSGSLLGVSAPTFMTGLLLQWLLAYRLRLLPLDGYGETTLDHLRGVVLPALTLGLFGAAYYTRMVRDEMLGQLGQDYIRTARAKGVGPVGVVVRHALRNALVPIVTILALEVGVLVGGAIVTEAIFRWPGLGSLSVAALLDRDGPMIMGCVIVTSTSVVLSTVVADVLVGWLDPRLRRD